VLGSEVHARLRCKNPGAFLFKTTRFGESWLAGWRGRGAEEEGSWFVEDCCKKRRGTNREEMEKL
jgi:hypothetical protein